MKDDKDVIWLLKQKDKKIADLEQQLAILSETVYKKEEAIGELSKKIQRRR